MTALGSGTPAQGPAALELCGLSGGYGRSVVVRGVDLQVPAGAVAALLGPNGAGKTTLLRMAAGLLKPRDGRITLLGEDVTARSAHERARRGLCLIPEGRGIFRVLSVRENLLLYCPPKRGADGLDRVFEIFPVLASRAGQVAGSLSGGEQQMLALARSFLSGPSVVLLDEVSMGLAPIVVDEIFSALQVLADTGIALLLVEQYVSRALAMADLVYLIEQGEVVYTGPPSGLDIGAVAKSYLGADVGRRAP